jgi:DNA-binding transcriptional ArsR family regulator
MLLNLVKENRATILQTWFRLVVETYPTDSTGFLANETDRFLNPVGTSLKSELDGMLRALSDDTGEEALRQSLDEIIKVRAIQEFTPSQAVAFVFLLKKAIRAELADNLTHSTLAEQLSALESKIDNAALLAFDLYMSRKERIYKIAANEMRSRTLRLLERINRAYGDAEQDQDMDSQALPSSCNKVCTERGCGK